MTQQTNYIVFECYGDEFRFHECLFALMSLSRVYGHSDIPFTEIWIYTDNPAWFQNYRGCELPVYIRQVDKATFEKWQGEIGLKERIKYCILNDISQKRFGNVIYVKTNIVFTGRLEPLFDQLSAGSLYLYALEHITGENGQIEYKRLHSYLEEHIMMKVRGRAAHELSLWDTGCLAFNTRSKHIIEDTLSFLDLEYNRYPKIVFEQFALTAYFQQEGEMKTIVPYLFHYDNFNEMRDVLASFFGYYKNRLWEDLVLLSAPIQVQNLMHEKITFLENMSALEKMMNKQWHPELPEWKILERQT